MQPPLGTLRLIAGGVALFIGNFSFLFALAFAPVLAMTAIGYAVAPSTTGVAEAAAPGLGGVLGLLVVAAIGFVVGGMLCLAALDVALGKRHGFGAYLRQALRHAAPLAGLGLVVGLATAAGLLLLVLPGLYLIARYLVYIPAIVFENAGWSGLGRAQALSEGYRWPLVGAVLLLGLAAVAVAILPSILVATTLSTVLAVLVDAVLQAVVICLSSTFTALVYLRLREIKDGATAAEIAAGVG